MDLVVSVDCHSVGGCYIDFMGIHHIMPPPGQARRRPLA